MQGLDKHGEGLNVLKAIEELEQNGWTDCSEEPGEAHCIPDLHAAMWRNFDLEIDFKSVQMLVFAAEHQKMLKNYEEYCKTNAAEDDADTWNNPSHAEWVQSLKTMKKID